MLQCVNTFLIRRSLLYTFQHNQICSMKDLKLVLHDPPQHTEIHYKWRHPPHLFSWTWGYSVATCWCGDQSTPPFSNKSCHLFRQLHIIYIKNSQVKNGIFQLIKMYLYVSFSIFCSLFNLFLLISGLIIHEVLLV